MICDACGGDNAYSDLSRPVIACPDCGHEERDGNDA